MNSRQRVEAALNHQQPDHVPLDLGASPVTGMHVSSVYKLRQALKLDPPGTPVKVVEPYQMLGEIAPDLQDALGVDVVGLGGPRTMFGFENKDWKPWTTLRRHARAGARRLQHRARAQRRHPHVSRGRPLGAAQRPDAQGRVLLRHDRPPGADRRRQAQRRGQPRGVRPDLRRRPAALRPRGRPAAARERPGDPGQLRRHGLRRHRPGARPVAEAPQGHPRHRRVVHEHGQPGSTTSTRSSAASATSPWRTWRRSTTPWATACRRCSSPAPISARRAGRSSARNAYRKLYPAVPPPRERLGPRAHAVEDVHPLLRLGDRAAARHHRGRASTSSTRCSARRRAWTRRR